MMMAKSPDFPDDKTAPDRRRDLTQQQVKDLELAGGVEGGMQAGSAGGPGSKDEQNDQSNRTHRVSKSD